MSEKKIEDTGIANGENFSLEQDTVETSLMS